MEKLKMYLIGLAGLALVVVAFTWKDLSYIPSDACLGYQSFATTLAMGQWQSVNAVVEGGSQAYKKIAALQRKSSSSSEGGKAAGGGPAYELVRGVTYRIYVDKVVQNTAKIESRQAVERAVSKDSSETKTVYYKHKVVLKKSEGVWRIFEFEEEEEE